MTSLAPAPSGTDREGIVDADARLDAGGTGADDHGRSASAPRLWVHLGLLVLALAAVLAVARPGVATFDEGSYGSQADLLRDGGWSGAYQFADIDPDGAWYPIRYGTRTETGWATYTKHPLVPALYSVVGGPLGQAGYVLPAVLGVMGAAASGWAIARRIRPGTEVLAFWIIASGPLVFHASIIWGHSMGAAFGGLAVLGAVMVRQRLGSWVAHLALVAGLAGSVLVRSEGLLMALCLIAAVGLDALLRPTGSGRDPAPPFGRRLVLAVASTVPAFVAVVATWFLEQRWWTAIVGSADPSLEVRSTDAQYSYLGGRIHGFWESTLAGSDVGSYALLLPILLLVPLALVIFRRRIARPDLLARSLGGYALAMGVLQLVHPSLLVGGLVPAWPLMTLGVAACGAGLWRQHRLLAITAALTAAAIWATQYPDGGAFQWGGRFLMVIAVPLAVMAADGVRRLLDEAAAVQAELPRRTSTFVAVVVLGAVSAVAPVIGLHTVRDQMRDMLGPIEAAAGPITVTTSEEMPRLLWRSDIEWLHVEGDDLDVALGRLRDQGLESVSLVATEEDARPHASAFGRIVEQTQVPGSPLSVWELEALPSS